MLLEYPDVSGQNLRWFRSLPRCDKGHQSRGILTPTLATQRNEDW